MAAKKDAKVPAKPAKQSYAVVRGFNYGENNTRVGIGDDVPTDLTDDQLRDLISMGALEPVSEKKPDAEADAKPDEQEAPDGR